MYFKLYRPKSEYYELPTKYNETVVRLLVQSPTRMYVYWEVADRTVKNFASKNIDYNSSRPILKITNLTMNYSYEIEIDPFTTNYYIEVKDADCSYKVELGRKSHDQFVSIYASNNVTIPRSAPIFNRESEEIIYRNCMRLTQTDKFTIYYQLNKGNNKFNPSLKQDYYALSFDVHETFSSGELQSSGAFYKTSKIS